VQDGLNDRKKSIKGSRILILGIAYKKNIDDMRESPSVRLMELLRLKGALIDYSDPYLPVFPKMREHYFDLKSIPISARSISAYDCILVATNHDLFDYELILKHANLIVDTRGVFTSHFSNVIRA